MLQYLKNVVTLRLDDKSCTGCGICATVCPHGVFRIEDKKAVVAEKDACIECGACAINCPTNAVTVQTGVGCATGVILGALGSKGCECSGSCGVSPAANSSTQAESSQTSCCGPQTQDNKSQGGSSCCGR